MSLLSPTIWLVALACMLGSYGTGRWQQWRSDEKEAVAQRLAGEVAARAKEQFLNAENGKVTDELLKDRATAVAAAASSAQRLRNLSRASSEAASACRRLDEPAVTVLRDDTRENLEREAQRADQVTIQLTKLQDYVSRVCQSPSP